MITILDNVVSVFLNLINFNGNLNLIVPEKPHWGGNNKVCMYVCTTATVRKNDLTRDQVFFIPFLKNSNFSIKHRIHHHLAWCRAYHVSSMPACVEPIRTESLTLAGFPLSELHGPLPIMAYKGSLRPKGVLFSGFRHIKG